MKDRFLDFDVKIDAGRVNPRHRGRVEFAPGRGQIHLHMLGITKNCVYLNTLYKAESIEYKAAVVDKYTRDHLDITTDINIKCDDRNNFTKYPESPLSRKFCDEMDEAEDARKLYQY